MESKACCHVANAFLSRSELIWPISRLKIFKMSKRCVFDEKIQVSIITSDIFKFSKLDKPLSKCCLKEFSNVASGVNP